MGTFNKYNSYKMLVLSTDPPTVSVLVLDIDVGILQAGTLLWILDALQFGYECRLSGGIVA